MKRLLLLAFTLFISAQLYAQDESIDDLFETKYETPLTINMDEEGDLEAPEDPADKKKKKKKNPKVFWGIKTKRGFTKTGFGDRVVIEQFHYLKDKDYVGPEKYVRDFYWYDFKKKKIVNSRRHDRKNAGVLHGKYKKIMGEQVLEEGYFYKGVKHGRWVKLNRHDILQDKEVYWRGWPEQSLLSYYDFERTKLREVVPVHFGEREGEYYAYHENGNIAVIGEYKFDNRIGIWREYYDNKRIKREVLYPSDPFSEKPPVILKEWDNRGNVIYDREKFYARAN